MLARVGGPLARGVTAEGAGEVRRLEHRVRLDAGGGGEQDDTVDGEHLIPDLLITVGGRRWLRVASAPRRPGTDPWRYVPFG